MVEESQKDPWSSKEIERQLGRIANLLALSLTSGRTQAEQVVTLTAAGFSPAEIAGLLGTTPNTVSVQLYQSRQKTKKATKKATKKNASKRASGGA